MTQFMEQFSDIGSSLTGNIHKAMLCVKKPLLEGEIAPKDLTASSIDLRAKLLSTNGSLVKGVKTFAKVETSAKMLGFHVMQVKYNPSSIHFSTTAGSFIKSGPGGAGITQITQITTPAQTDMYFQIIFDDVSIPDAFMLEKFVPSTGGAVSAVAGIAKQFIKDGYSVQAQMEGLVALVTQSETRQVVFYWSDMAFAGEVIEVEATYTMFNPSGHPIRGVVGLKIRQTDSEDGDDSKSNKVYWENAFKHLFGEQGKSKNFKAGKAMDKVGNIFNL